MNSTTKLVLRLLALGIALVVLWQLGPGVLERQDLFGRSAYEAETEARTASLPIQYVGSATCSQCHQEQHDGWQETKHQAVSCETCHGPGRAHVQGEGEPSPDTSREACGMCHDELAARPGDFPQVSLVQHNTHVACVACHNPMASARQVPHPVDEATSCLACHGLQGLAPLPESHAGRTGEVCRTCHEVATVLPASTPTASPAEPGGTSGPPGVPHSLEGRLDCLACHGPAGFKPFPGDHEGRSGDLCLGCHKKGEQ